jgi:L-amino acid N-acyltransferase YncA
MINIRAATQSDHDAIWDIFHAVIRAGDTYVFDPRMPRAEALDYWFRSDTHTYVAENGSQVVGTYILKPNQPGLGSHIANASFMVSPVARGLGAGKRMGEHCLVEARQLGFRALQFNFVISTNEIAVRLWQQLGFQIVGTLPGAYRHSTLGFVEPYVMFRRLDDVA